MSTFFNLLPSEYTDGIKIKLTLKLTIISLIILGIIVGSSAKYLNLQSKQIQEKIDQITRDKENILAQKKKISTSKREEISLKNKIKKLGRIYDNINAQLSFQILTDLSKNSHVWLNQLSFTSITTNKSNTLSIKGQAKDYSSLSNLIRNAANHENISATIIKQAKLRQYTKYSVVDFDLELVLDYES